VFVFLKTNERKEKKREKTNNFKKLKLKNYGLKKYKANGKSSVNSLPNCLFIPKPMFCNSIEFSMTKTTQNLISPIFLNLKISKLPSLNPTQ
jgi:hypothetical protein